MKVIVDTSVWSLALRRKNLSQTNSVVILFQDLIIQGNVVLLGAVRQEILSGIRYNRLKDSLRAFPNLELHIKDYELASEFFNTCRGKGIQGANTDFLICAAAVNRNYSILTTDQDFDSFAQYISIKLIK